VAPTGIVSFMTSTSAGSLGSCSTPARFFATTIKPSSCVKGAIRSTSIKQKLIAFIQRLPLARIRFQKINRQETFWVLDLRDNSVRRVGELSQIPGTGSSWRPSPGFRYGCNVPNNAEEGSALFLCDLETGVFEKIKLQGEVQGWWDASQILLRDPANNFILFEVITRTTRTLFTATALANSLRQMGLTNGAGRIWRSTIGTVGITTSISRCKRRAIAKKNPFS